MSGDKTTRQPKATIEQEIQSILASLKDPDAGDDRRDDDFPAHGLAAGVDRFQAGLEYSLARSNFLDAPTVYGLQALTLFLRLTRARSPGRSAWIMHGTVLQAAQSIDFHRDGDNFGLSPFESEMHTAGLHVPCNPAVPLPRLTIQMVRMVQLKNSLVSQLQLLTATRTKATGRSQVPRATAVSLLGACQIIELSPDIQADELLQHMRWASDIYPQYHVLLHLVCHLCEGDADPRGDAEGDGTSGLSARRRNDASLETAQERRRPRIGTTTTWEAGAEADLLWRRNLGDERGDEADVRAKEKVEEDGKGDTGWLAVAGDPEGEDDDAGDGLGDDKGVVLASLVGGSAGEQTADEAAGIEDGQQPKDVQQRADEEDLARAIRVEELADNRILDKSVFREYNRQEQASSRKQTSNIQHLIRTIVIMKKICSDGIHTIVLVE
ncbi:transcription factor, fungi [Grosmannia clavigera kw1407]|uniref:Transcription factor, fungi n=1 Tax=Grosmannia clavigera (strain kw1407 / UAMH 11150) TaxID=655863 RepID=F0X886_GROCL|nr:uncharacterized protein CMQ_3883 [Grosmannia clavigera kw1407]EFX05814.1 transcription factor, fungi [Grosmannia clavigera kw1407]